MVEWWQTLLIALATGAIGVIGSIAAGLCQHLWTTDAAIKAEKRAADRTITQEERSRQAKIDEERREAARAYRRERIQDVIDCLDKAKRYRALEATIRSSKSAWDDNIAGAKDKIRWEDWERSLRKGHPAPTFNEVIESIDIAAATAETSMVKALQDILRAIRDPDGDVAFRGALRSAEVAIEAFIVSDLKQPNP